MTTKTKARSAPSGTELSAREQSPTRRLCRGIADEMGITDADASRTVSALFEVLAHLNWRIHENVPVCTHCRSEVDAILFEALGRLDGIRTEQAQAMIDKARSERAGFVAGLEERGVKV